MSEWIKENRIKLYLMKWGETVPSHHITVEGTIWDVIKFLIDQTNYEWENHRVDSIIVSAKESHLKE